MKISIVIPVYNEISTIEEIIKRVLKTQIGLRKEIIIIDDYSTDGTREYLGTVFNGERSMGGTDNLEIVFHSKNLGKSAAVRTGLLHVTGDVVLIQDADLEYDPKDYKALLQPILNGHADAVFGNRFHTGTHRVPYFWHYAANRLLTILCNLAANLHLTDMEVGYKAFRAEVMKTIETRSNRFGFEPEITLKLARHGYRIYEVPISYNPRSYKEGKKINWRDSLAALFYIARYCLYD